MLPDKQKEGVSVSEFVIGFYTGFFTAFVVGVLWNLRTKESERDNQTLNRMVHIARERMLKEKRRKSEGHTDASHESAKQTNE